MPTHKIVILSKFSKEGLDFSLKAIFWSLNEKKNVKLKFQKIVKQSVENEKNVWKIKEFYPPTNSTVFFPILTGSLTAFF